MSKPLGPVLIDYLTEKGCDKAGQFTLAESLVRIVKAEVHKFLNGTRPGWEVIDELERAAEELMRHGAKLQHEKE